VVDITIFDQAASVALLEAAAGATRTVVDSAGAAARVAEWRAADAGVFNVLAKGRRAGSGGSRTGRYAYVGMART